MIIDGFESPLGMELLATVDWLLSLGGKHHSRSSIREGLASWHKGVTAAPANTLDDRLLGLVLKRSQNSN
jgi:hypothetical protein